MHILNFGQNRMLRLVIIAILKQKKEFPEYLVFLRKCQELGQFSNYDRNFLSR